MAFHTLSLCAGVGALDLGVRIARPDARCVAFVEREASAAASLVASMEAGRLHPAPVWSDLRTFDAGAWRGAVDCVLSGDPCQGNSVAGKRPGAADDRWLLDRAINVFDQSGAHTFFRENVPGNLDGQLAVAIPALEALGCRVACGIFSAAEAGASHRRERFFLLAHRKGFIGRVPGECTPPSPGQDADPCRCCGELGDAIGGGGSGIAADPGRRAFGRAAAVGTGGRCHRMLEDAASRGCAARIEFAPGQVEHLQGQGRPTLTGDRDGGLVDALGARRPPAGRGPAFNAGSQSVPRSRDVGDTHRADVQRGGAGGDPRGWQEPPRHAGLAVGGFPADHPPGGFAPGPADPVWADILDADPLAAPALGSVDLWTAARRAVGHPPLVDAIGRRGGMARDLDPHATAALVAAVRRMADGMAGRTERLRHGGNGVVPLTAANAWVRLHGLLADAAAGDAVRSADDLCARAAAAVVSGVA